MILEKNENPVSPIKEHVSSVNLNTENLENSEKSRKPG